MDAIDRGKRLAFDHLSRNALDAMAIVARSLRLLHELPDEQLALRDAMRESVAKFLAGEEDEESDQAGMARNGFAACQDTPPKAPWQVEASE